MQLEQKDVPAVRIGYVKKYCRVFGDGFIVVNNMYVHRPTEFVDYPLSSS